MRNAKAEAERSVVAEKQVPSAWLVGQDAVLMRMRGNFMNFSALFQ